MADLIHIVLIAGFFLAALAYLNFCGSLQKGDKQK